MQAKTDFYYLGERIFYKKILLRRFKNPDYREFSGKKPGIQRKIVNKISGREIFSKRKK